VGSIWLEGGREGAVCGEAAELRGGVADDELWARNWGGGVVYCVRGGVAKLGGPSNRLMDRQRGREKRGTAHRGGRRWRRLFHELCSDEGGEEWPRPVWGRRGSGRPFYRRAREGERWSFAAPVSLHSAAHKCRTEPPMRHHGGAVPARTLVKGGRTERCQTSLCGEKTEKGTEAMAGGDRDEGTTGKTTKRLTSGATLPVGVIASEAMDGAADGWGRLVSERERERRAGWRARAGAGRKWAKGRESWARGGRRAAAAWAEFSPAEGGKGFSLFLFIF
jgi:hypothetical protein